MNFLDFSDKVLNFLEQNPEVSLDEALVQILKEEFKDTILNDQDIITEVIQNPVNYPEIVELITKEDLSVPSEDLINELLYRYHNHDTVVKQFISDVQLNNPKSLIPTK